MAKLAATNAGLQPDDVIAIVNQMLANAAQQPELDEQEELLEQEPMIDEQMLMQQQMQVPPS